MALPRPDVSVTGTESSSGHQVDVLIRRANSQRSYRGVGSTRDGATVDAIKGILADPHTLEWIPERKP
jgi:hypothetical protein